VYLPLELTTPIFIGGLIAYWVAHHLEKQGRIGEEANRLGLLLASGLIAGEAIVGVLIAIPIVVTGQVDVLSAPDWLQWGQWPGLLGLGVIGYGLFRFATKPSVS
jgi:hypothetical protein